MIRTEIITAVRDEEETILVFLEAIAALALPDDIELKVIFVEDSSTDGTKALLRKLASEDPSVGYYSLVEGFGQCPAIMFGLAQSPANAMIMMDVDGSHPIEIIPEMISEFLDGAKVVQCVRKTLSNRRLHRRIGTALYQAVARAIIGIDTREQAIYYRLVSREIVQGLKQEPRYWHYLRFPLPRHPDGALRKIYVDMEERVFGESTYTIGRLVKLAIDGTLSQISKQRFAVLLGMGAGVSILLAFGRIWSLSAIVLVALLLTARHYQSLGRGDLLERMHVSESGNVSNVSGS